jgi:tRNA dimethylallyltransferase
MQKVIVITGPTGVGKTYFSIKLAKLINGEIINADSTQVYRGLDIGTAKVKDMDGIPHHLIDIKDITEDYTVYDFQKDARNIIDDIISRGKVPIMVGGSGLYINSVLYNYEFYEEEKHDYSYLTDEELYNKVISLDSNLDIHKNNRKRLERALSYMENHKVKLSDKKVTNKLLYDAVVIGLTTPRENLYNIINQRVDEMIKDGLINEARRIYDSGVRTKAVMTPIGYKELFEYFDGNMSLEESINLIKQRSRKYAKRQYTWFRNKMDVTFVTVNYDDLDETLNKIRGLI